MANEPPVVVDDDAVPALRDFVRGQGLGRLFLVADHNTYRALGRRVEAELAGGGVDVKTILLAQDEIAPDEQTLVQVLVAAGDDARPYLAVGSGVITDVVRFVSHRTRLPFISLPTAPSVDAYTSTGSSLIVNRLKRTIYGQAPMAVFADLGTLCAAPRPMIAAGFGDVVAKYTSLADWQLGHVCWEAPYSAAVARRMQVARNDCMQDVDAISRAEPEGIRSLIVALIEAGLCMLEFGGSQPAGQSEHYVSHYLEMKLVQEGRPAVLHGAKTGMATVVIAGYYDRIRRMDQDEAAARLAAARLPSLGDEMDRIRRAYGSIADEVVEEQAAFLKMTEDGFEGLKARILARWPEVLAVAAGVPPPARLAALLSRVGGAIDHRSLGLGDAEMAMAVEYGHYVRSRFTVMKLARLLGLLA